jgi:hypothetical protein
LTKENRTRIVQIYGNELFFFAVLVNRMQRLAAETIAMRIGFCFKNNAMNRTKAQPFFEGIKEQQKPLFESSRLPPKRNCEISITILELDDWVSPTTVWGEIYFSIAKFYKYTAYQ